MTFGRKDLAATALTALAVLAFAATHQGWNVWLVGGSHRWAAAAVLALGMGACALGSPGRGAATRVLAVLGVVAFVLGVLALATGSLTPLSLLVVDVVLLWAAATARHLVQPPRPSAQH
ncbi:MAG TPA: hypothetical protein VFL60_04690 [Gaiellaceae bacterium]|nr:hypothetical protein [Gaiellaceae bacterium]